MVGAMGGRLEEKPMAFPAPRPYGVVCSNSKPLQLYMLS